MAKSYDEIPESLIEWIKKQHMFWVASAPLGPGGHVNLSPKGTADCFHVVDSHRVWYEDLSGSGAETIAHIRENGRVTVLFQAFEGPPRILRLYGIGIVYEFGTQEYESFISPEIRRPGCRSVIVIDVYQCQTSCGYAVPIYHFVTHRTQLLRISDKFESFDRTASTEISQKGLKAYWAGHNVKSLDGLPSLLTAPFCEAIPASVFDREGARPKLQQLSSRQESTLSSRANLAIGFALGALATTLLHRVLSNMGKVGMITGAST